MAEALWGEYRIKQPSGYNYSRFCYHLQQYLDQQKATIHIKHQPGEHMYIDFTGKKLSVVDPETGEIREAEVFVSLLGYSQMTYVEAVYTQTLGDFIRATEAWCLWMVLNGSNCWKSSRTVTQENPRSSAHNSR
jgi:transposase